STKMPHTPYTTLGTAASSSTRKATGCRIHVGANSVRKMATPSANGTASNRATREDISVPKISGPAPYTSATGSQRPVHRNPNTKHHPPKHIAPGGSSPDQPALRRVQRAAGPLHATRPPAVIDRRRA